MKRWLLAGALVGGALALVRSRPQPLSLWGKVVVVTGASSGIGRAAARLFAAEGARVVLVARRADALAKTQYDLAQFGAPSLVVSADVTQDADLQRIVAETLHAFGRIDVLVNNAGLSYGGALHTINPQRIRDLIAVNLIGPIRLTQAVLPAMLAQGSGHIVNVSSMAGQVAAPGMAAYAATRRGLVAFGDALRRELAETGIGVSSVLPSFTRTAMTADVSEVGLRTSGGLLPLEQFDVPEVPARAIVDAVRFRRRDVVMGGPQIRCGYVWERIAPQLVDVWWRLFVDVPAWIEAVRDLGA